MSRPMWKQPSYWNMAWRAALEVGAGVFVALFLLGVIRP
jgi:hypothetical protein